MAKLSLLNAKTYVAQYDLSGDLNAIALAYGAEAQDVTNFGSGGSRERIGGLKTVDLQLEGLWDGATDRVDQAMFPKLGLTDQLITIAPDGLAAEGVRAFAFLSAISKYGPGAQVGETLAFSLAGEASGSPLVRGQIMHNATRTATGNGTAYNLGAQPSGQRIFLGVHLLAISGGGALNVTLDADDNAGMATPLAVLASAALSAPAGDWAVYTAQLGGGETWWRTRWSLTGTTPSATFVTFVGFAP